MLNEIVGWIGAVVLFVTGLAAFLGVCLALRAYCDNIEI